MSYKIRRLRPADAHAYLQLVITTDAESNFMTTEPGERQTNAFQLSMSLHTGAQTIFVAESKEGQLIGQLSLMYLYGQGVRCRHVVHIGISVLKAHWGRGVGNQLFEALEKWAEAEGIIRLELSVMTHNERGIALYKKRGFEIEGIKKASIFVGGQYVDEYMMAKLLQF